MSSSKGGVILALQERIRVDGKTTDALAGELWEDKKERIKKASKWSSNPDWDLRSVSDNMSDSRFLLCWILKVGPYMRVSLVL